MLEVSCRAGSAIPSLASALSELTHTRPSQASKSIFHGQSAPSMSIEQYIRRISRYANCSDSVYIVTLIYVDRLKERNPQITIDLYSIHRILITAFMLAAKYYEDFYYKNQYYAKIGGISKDQINRLEMEFVKMIDYNMFVEERVYKMYEEKILGKIEGGRE